jgi:hypothetical protein
VTDEARYHEARLAAYRAWANSQPQQVIPGLLDGLDRSEVARAEGASAAASDLSNPPGSPPLRTTPGGFALNQPGHPQPFPAAARVAQTGA